MNLSGPDTSDSTSKSLIRRAQQHDPEAWRRLSRLYAPLVYGWARQANLQASDAADLGQEVFQTLAARIGDYRREQGGGFRAWLWGITRNKLREHARRRASEPGALVAADQWLAEIPDNEPTEFRQAEPQARLMHRALEVIRGEFEERTWQAFWRSMMDEQATADIAHDLQMTNKAVRQAKYRVLRRLRQEVAELD